jgi:formate dehydrogenase iron-sulfur subunit
VSVAELGAVVPLEIVRAVDTFADLHERGRTPTTGWYRSRIPTHLPERHQQFAFAVDLDACTGCKACVVACHSMNGLDEDELWRSVGLLQSVSDHKSVANPTPVKLAEPEQRTVTTACHHCADPACLNGCPVNAYEKDVITGAVIHLDDQCIGCSYCTMTCPYDVPVFNDRLGIVRKCDMCHGRLLAGEAPACVQGCPNSAITIEIVDRAQQVTAKLVAGAPRSMLTSPSTKYTTRLDPDLLEQVDELQARPAAAHFPLVAMLVLTQMAVGLSVAEVFLGSRIVSALATGFAVIGIGASTAHLGRPLQAWRVVLGLGHSWLSREAVALGAFAGMAMVHVLWRSTLSAAFAAIIGVAAVFTSIKVYAVTRREMWSLLRTSGWFGSIVGIGALCTVAIASRIETVRTQTIFGGLILLGIVFLVGATRVRRYRSSDSVGLQRTAILLRRDLRNVHGGHLGGTVGAIGMLLLALATHSSACIVGSMIAAGVAFVCERTLFFRAVSPDRMPV